MPKTLLLADDSVTIQKVVGISFANEDVVLLTVDNGDDAVSRAREARPDLVLADVMMPGKDGYEVCETLKADPELRHVPVLLLSGTFEPFDEERARRAGADGHITKPFEAQALVDQVNALLARVVEEPQPHPSSGAGEATLAVGGGDAGDAFDFFDDEMARTAPSPSGVAPTLLDDADPAGGDAGDPLELEAAVEEEEPALPAPASTSDALFADAGDSQATVLFEDAPTSATLGSPTPPPFLGDGFDAEALKTPAPPAPPLPVRPDADAPTGYEESFDFGFDEGAATTATVSVPVAPAPAPAPTPPPFSAATRLFDEEEQLEEPLASAPPPVVALPSPPPAFTAAPPPVPTPAPPPLPELAPPPPLASPAPASAPVAVHVSGPAALSEPIQKQLQETLEKIVWEAFGDLTERIVRDVLERVEAVAWEVIPQMAETLIREEIRQLKDGEES